MNIITGFLFYSVLGYKYITAIKDILYVVPTHWGWTAGGIWDRRFPYGPPAVLAALPPAPDLSGPDLTESTQIGTEWKTVPPENKG